MRKVLKFLFPIQSIVVWAVLGILLAVGEVDGAPIQVRDWLSFMVTLFMVVIIPLDVVIFLIKKIVSTIKTRRERNENLSQKKYSSYNNRQEKTDEKYKELFNELSGEYKNIIAKQSGIIKQQTEKIASIENGLEVLKKNSSSVLSSESTAKSENQEENPCSDEVSNEANDENIVYKHVVYVDPLFEEAGKFIIERGIASVGMMQRAFKIGFNRAYRIMRQLQDNGVVGREEGTKLPKILMNINEFEQYLKNIELYDKPETDFDTVKTERTPDASERITMYNDKFDYMEGHDFEEYCALILKHMGYQSVEVTKGSNDNGIDILASKGGVKYGIQCKCYSSDIGVKAIQEAYAGAKYYDCHVPVVLTNRRFTKQAQEMAKKNNVLLWDREILMLMVDNFRKTKD